MGMIVSTVLSNLVLLQRNDDCFEIHIPRKELCDPQFLKITKNFRSGHDSTSASSARRPCNLGSQTDIENLGPSGSE